MNHIEQYYTNYDEEGRLLSRHGQVEYLTTMKYIHDYLGADKSKRILEVGAGTGRYCVTLAKEGLTRSCPRHETRRSDYGGLLYE